MTGRRWTPARRRGFEILAAHDPACCRESNTTDEKAGYIYWQVARWLVEEGLAYFPSGSIMLSLTAEGHKEKAG